LKVAAEWSFAEVPITALAVMPPILGGNIEAPHKLLLHASSKNIAHRRKCGKMNCKPGLDFLRWLG